MSTARGPALVRDHPRAVTAVLTVVGYVAVIGTLYGDVGLYPELAKGTVERLAAAIAVVNVSTVGCLVAGWYWIRDGQVRKHRLAMSTAFVLILLFLVLYLLKTGGGGRKEVLAGAPFRTLYLGMLGVHIVLSVLSVPLVLYAITLGTTHTPAELAETPHARVGRLAVSAWLVSLALGVVAYLMLAFFYGPEHVEYVTGVA
jgi:putative membrane protein